MPAAGATPGAVGASPGAGGIPAADGATAGFAALGVIAEVAGTVVAAGGGETWLNAVSAKVKEHRETISSFFIS